MFVFIYLSFLVELVIFHDFYMHKYVDIIKWTLFFRILQKNISQFSESIKMLKLDQGTLQTFT